MTSDPSAWIKEKAMKEGAHYFLEKPFSRTTIDHVLDQLNVKKERGAANKRINDCRPLSFKQLPISHHYSREYQ